MIKTTRIIRVYLRKDLFCDICGKKSKVAGQIKKERMKSNGWTCYDCNRAKNKKIQWSHIPFDKIHCTMKQLILSVNVRYQKKLSSLFQDRIYGSTNCGPAIRDFENLKRSDEGRILSTPGFGDKSMDILKKALMAQCHAGEL